MTVALEMTGVSKSYGRTQAVADVHLHINEGEVVGLIGPNGAGKTTTLKIALDLATDFAGTVRLFGQTYASDPLLIKRRIGYVPETVEPPGALRIGEYVRYAAALHNVPAPEVNAAWTELTERLQFRADPRTRIDTLSKGNRQKLATIISRLHRPGLWVLDEPLTGLDPDGMRLLETMIAECRGTDTAVLVSTHALDFVERTCDRVYVMAEGRIVGESASDGTATAPTHRRIAALYERSMAGSDASPDPTQVP